MKKIAAIIMMAGWMGVSAQHSIQFKSVGVGTGVTKEEAIDNAHMDAFNKSMTQWITYLFGDINNQGSDKWEIKTLSENVILVKKINSKCWKAKVSSKHSYKN